MNCTTRAVELIFFFDKTVFDPSSSLTAGKQRPAHQKTLSSWAVWVVESMMKTMSSDVHFSKGWLAKGVSLASLVGFCE